MHILKNESNIQNLDDVHPFIIMCWVDETGILREPSRFKLCQGATQAPIQEPFGRRRRYSDRRTRRPAANATTYELDTRPWACQ
jgi:hypothetical protein